MGLFRCVNYNSRSNIRVKPGSIQEVQVFEVFFIRSCALFIREKNRICKNKEYRTRLELYFGPDVYATTVIIKEQNKIGKPMAGGTAVDCKSTRKLCLFILFFSCALVFVIRDLQTSCVK